MRLNFPMRSTIQAVCCGTNRTIVFVGRRLCDEKYEGGPACEFSWPSDEKTLVGLAEADCEESGVKLRADDVVKAAANVDLRGIASGREFWSSLAPVEAASWVRDAMMRFGARGGDGHAELEQVPPYTGEALPKSLTPHYIIHHV